MYYNSCGFSLDGKKKEDLVEALLKWHQNNRRLFPWRITKDPYKTFIAEFFLQRTPANRVAKFFPEFITRFPSPEELAHADLSYLEGFSRTLGLKKRMGWLIKSMKIICRKYGGKIPNTFEHLISLPGVGEYTASAILCFGFGCEVPIVDANVIRVLSRIFGLRENFNKVGISVKDIARKILPNGQVAKFNEALLDFAALICKKKPLCNECPVSSLCEYRRKSHRTQV